MSEADAHKIRLLECDKNAFRHYGDQMEKMRDYLAEELASKSGESQKY
jgi:hypothetical protein